MDIVTKEENTLANVNKQPYASKSINKLCFKCKCQLLMRHIALGINLMNSRTSQETKSKQITQICPC